MAAKEPENLHILDVRIATFAQVHSRRRISSINAKNPTSPLRWPHKNPSPEALAQAGFYYRPTVASPDNACCFLCKKSLDGWESDDVPAIEHAKHSSNCGWALVHITAIKLRGNRKAVIDDPKGEMMLEARKMTYQNCWPHEKKKGWKPKMEKCAEAGFHYAPTADSDDFVQCAYCELGLDGWEPDDDPLVEHQRRQPDCKFFTWKKPRQRRGSVASAREARSASVDSRIGSQIESDISGTESVVYSKGFGGRKGARGRPPATGGKRRGRGKDTDASDFESVAGSPQRIHKPPRGRKRNSSVLGEPRVAIFEESDFIQDPKPAAKGRKPKRPRASNATVVDEDSQMQYESDASVATNATATRRKRGVPGVPLATRGKRYDKRELPDDDELDRRLAMDLERSSDSEIDTTRYTKPFVKTPKRRLTRSRVTSQQDGGAPPLMAPLGSVQKSSKLFTPSGIRNYFGNQTMDYSLPISIPSHLARSEPEEAPALVKEKSVKGKGKGRQAQERTPLPPPVRELEPETQEVAAMEEKPVKKGGRKGKKDAIGVAAALPKLSSSRRVLDNSGPESVPTLRNIRKSIDGGMILFDGGADSNSEAEAVPQSVLDPMSEAEPEPLPKKKGGKKVPVGKGRKGKAAAMETETENTNDEAVDEISIVTAEDTSMMDAAPVKRGRKPTSKKATKAGKRSSNASISTQILESEPAIAPPATAQEPPAQRPQRTSGDKRLSDQMSGEDLVTYPSLPTALEDSFVSRADIDAKRAKKRYSGSRQRNRLSNSSVKLGSVEAALEKSFRRGPSLVLDGVRAPSLGKEQVEEYQVFHTDELDHDMDDDIHEDAAAQQLASEDREMRRATMEKQREDDEESAAESVIVRRTSDRKSASRYPEMTEDEAHTTGLEGDIDESDNELVVTSPKKSSPRKASPQKSSPRKASPEKESARKSTNKSTPRRRLSGATIKHGSGSKMLQPERITASPFPSPSPRIIRTLVISPRPARHAPPPANKDYSFAPTEKDNTYHDDDTEVEEYQTEEDKDAKDEESKEDTGEEEEEEEEEGDEADYEDEAGSEDDDETDVPDRLTPSKQRSSSSKLPQQPYVARLPLSPVKQRINDLLPAPPTPTHTRKVSSSSSSGALISSEPWVPIDVDAVVPFPDSEEDGGEVEDLLTAEESEMTVQEWVKRNAEIAEMTFRERCEEVIGKFMEEGKRAIKTIEGIRGV